MVSADFKPSYRRKVLRDQGFKSGQIVKKMIALS